jgi:two-component system response regulator QseB
MHTEKPSLISHNKPRLLLVEDDPSLGDGIHCALTISGYETVWSVDGLEADRRLKQDHFDLVVLDLGLPGIPGLEVLRGMRTRGDHTPVLILTAQDSIEDRIAGLDQGGDDYLVKPFDLDELSARLRALSRRSNGQSRSLLQHGEIMVDIAAHIVTKGGIEIKVSPHEFQILRMLLENTGSVLSRNRLEDALYGWDMNVESNTVEVHIHFLRKKLGDSLIRTVRGIGYAIDRIDS